MRRDETAAPKSEGTQSTEQQGAPAQQGSQAQKGSESQQDNKATEGKQSNNLLTELMGPKGLGSIKGNAKHGIGLFPVSSHVRTSRYPSLTLHPQMRRDTNQVEARQAPPIQGSTLTDVLLQGGALGKVTKMLSPATPEKKPGSSDPIKAGDGSISGPPDPASGAGPHSGPGLAAEGRNGDAPAAQ